MSATLRATFTPHLRTGVIPTIDVRADAPEALRIALFGHVFDSAYRVEPYDVTVSRDLSGGVVWVGDHCADTGWIITLESGGER